MSMTKSRGRDGDIFESVVLRQTKRQRRIDKEEREHRLEKLKIPLVFNVT